MVYEGRRRSTATCAMIATLAGAVLLSGCGNRGMINIARNQVGPDEFAILPSKPIEIPENLSELPPPTPGRPNRTDRNPQAEAVAAMGGNPDRVTPTGTVSADGSLVTYAGRHGTNPQIREELALADAEYRRRNRGRLLERWFGQTTYYDAYAWQELDQHRELERVRAAGVRTPGAPPVPTE